MVAKTAAFGSFWCLFALAGCDSASDFDKCNYSPDLTEPAGARCPKSTFPDEDSRGRQITGVVRVGSEPFPGAIVRVTASALTPMPFFPNASVTNNVGAYQFNFAPLRYDIAAVVGREVMIYRGVGYRALEPTFDEGTSGFAVRVYRTRVEFELARPVADGHTLAFAVSGDRAFRVVGSLETGVFIETRDFATPVTLYAVEYPIGADLRSATRFGSTPLDVDGSGTVLSRLALDPIATRADLTFTAPSPAGLVPENAEILIAFGQKTSVLTLPAPVGMVTSVPVLPSGAYTYRLRATGSGGAIFDTGESFLDVFAKTVKATFVEPPVAVTPPAGALVTIGDVVTATGSGVLEYTFTPLDAGPKVRVIADSDAVQIPALDGLGLPPFVGRYSWTVRGWPTLKFVEQLSGPDSRRFQPNSISAPRELVVR